MFLPDIYFIKSLIVLLDEFLLIKFTWFLSVSLYVKPLQQRCFLVEYILIYKRHRLEFILGPWFLQVMVFIKDKLLNWIRIIKFFAFLDWVWSLLGSTSVFFGWGCPLRSSGCGYRLLLHQNVQMVIWSDLNDCILNKIYKIKVKN